MSRRHPIRRSKSSHLTQVTSQVHNPTIETAAPDATIAVTETVSVDQVIFDGGNVRRRDDRAEAAIENSIKQYGPARSIVLDGSGIVRAGNGTLKGFIATGGTEILKVHAGPNQLVAVVRDDWSPVEATGYAIADNQIATKATWDYQGLGATIKSLTESGHEIAALGFEAHELEPILAANWTPAPLGELPSSAGSKPPSTDGSHSVSFSAETWETIADAVAEMREAKGNLDLTEAQCLELICADYLLPR
jgi:hypothetical protein